VWESNPLFDPASEDAVDGNATPLENARMKPEGTNVGAVLWIIWMTVFVYLMVKHRNTVPLSWGADPKSPGLFIGLGALLTIGTIYVWWANRRDSK
jgi:hypothetical protein